MFDDLFRALLGVPGFIATVAAINCELDTSIGVSGPHGFVERVTRASSCAPMHPSHPGPRFMTIAKRPSCGRDAQIEASDLPDEASVRSATD
jgi:hypothetical protein